MMALCHLLLNCECGNSAAMQTYTYPDKGTVKFAYREIENKCPKCGKIATRTALVPEGVLLQSRCNDVPR